MHIEFRNCEYNDLDFIVNLKELCFKWYVEKIYGWDINVQINKTLHELDRHIQDMRVIIFNNEDIGITTFYEEDDVYVVGLIMIHPDYQKRGIATSIIKDYIDIAKCNNKKIKIKTYKENPAKILYERLEFKVYNEDNTHVYMFIDFRNKE